jgi:hypothetical protein
MRIRESRAIDRSIPRSDRKTCHARPKCHPCLVSGQRPPTPTSTLGDFIGNGRDQLLLYDRAAGQADVVGFDDNGSVTLDLTNSGWRPSSTRPHQQRVAPLFNTTAQMQLQRDIITHEFFHLIGLRDIPTIGNTRDA